MFAARQILAADKPTVNATLANTLFRIVMPPDIPVRVSADQFPLRTSINSSAGYGNSD